MIKKYSIDIFLLNENKKISLLEDFISISFISILVIIKQKITSFFPYILFVILFFKLNTLQAQVQNDGELYISDNSVFYAEGDNFNFGTGSTTTTRTKLDYGILSFSKGASWSGANDLHFVDGYAQTQSNTAFILPIGQSGVYAPIQVIPSTSEGVDAAYFRSAPKAIGNTLDTSISSISSVEYWDISGMSVNAGISLSWRPSSAISDLTSSSISNLTIVGWNGSKWVLIPSSVDKSSILGNTSSLDFGSISSNAAVDLKAYSAFSLGKSSKVVSPELNGNQFIAFLDDDRLIIESSSRITGVVIYDMTGRKIVSKKLDGEYKYNIEFIHAEEVYIAKIEFDYGVLIGTKKLINRIVFH